MVLAAQLREDTRLRSERGIVMGRCIKMAVCFFICFSICANPLAVEYDVEAIAFVQEYLNENGYDCGTVDGILGSKTSNAISQYQIDHGLEATGQVSAELLDEIEGHSTEEGSSSSWAEETDAAVGYTVEAKISLMQPVVQTYASLENVGEVDLSSQDADRFWDMLYLFGIYKSQYDHANQLEDTTAFRYSDEDVQEIGYALFNDFDGTVPFFEVNPTHGRDLAQGKYYLAPATPLRQKLDLLSYTEKEDGSIDATYSFGYGETVNGVLEYIENARQYVHMVPNEMVNANSTHPLYYRMEAMRSEPVAGGEEGESGNASEQLGDIEAQMPNLAYREAYVEVITSQKTIPNAYNYYLIYVDGDDVPELVIDTGNRAGGCGVFTFDEAENTARNIGLLFPFQYLEKQNYLIWQDVYTGGYRNYAYRIQSGRWETVAKADMFTSANPRATWFDEPISEGEYNEYLAEYFGSDRVSGAVTPENPMDFYEVLGVLKEP